MDLTELNGEWRRDVGTTWPWVLAALAIACAVTGWFFPVTDPDLPMHLRTAEWIVREGRVPFTEPFAWTRPGAPFFAYSWLAELLYLGALTAFGEQGLHAVHAFTAAGAFLVVVALGRASRWTPWGTLLVALMSYAVWISFIGAVRPQAFMGLTVPLSWLAAEWMARGRVRDGAVLAVMAAMLTVNTHLLFVVSVMPVLRLLAEPVVPWRRTAGFVAATLLGWMITPYLFVLPDILRTNLLGNALIGPATGVSELEAGWKAFTHTSISIKVAAMILLVAPIAIPSRLISDRERFFYGLAWAGGAFLFGNAVRGIVIWFIATLPLLARMAAVIPLPELERTRRINRLATMLVPLGLMGGVLQQRTRVPDVTVTRATRQLAVPSAALLEPLVRVLECGASTGARVYTVFNFGSYLGWRLPSMSYSIDGRTIFPDSVAAAEALQHANSGPMQLGPWRSADVAIAPVAHATAQAIASSPEWRLLRVSLPSDTTDRPAGLWARHAWLAMQRGASVPTVGDTVRASMVMAPPTSCVPAASSR